MNSGAKGYAIVHSVLKGSGVTVLFLLLGTLLDYLVTQILSQFILGECSEDCYFRYFNFFFVIVVLVSLFAGIRSEFRTYRQFS